MEGAPTLITVQKWSPMSTLVITSRQHAQIKKDLQIPVDDPNRYFVWSPRFAIYKICSGQNMVNPTSPKNALLAIRYPIRNGKSSTQIGPVPSIDCTLDRSSSTLRASIILEEHSAMTMSCGYECSISARIAEIFNSRWLRPPSAEFTSITRGDISFCASSCP